MPFRFLYPEISFKIGDHVKLVAGQYIDNEYNPKWDGICGKVVGKVVQLVVGKKGSDPMFWVLWANGKRNQYTTMDIELIPQTTEEVIKEINSTTVQKKFIVKDISITHGYDLDIYEATFYAISVQDAMRYCYYKYHPCPDYVVNYGQYQIFRKGDWKPPVTVEEIDD